MGIFSYMFSFQGEWISDNCAGEYSRWSLTQQLGYNKASGWKTKGVPVLNENDDMLYVHLMA